MDITELVKSGIELVVVVASMWLIPWIRAKLGAEKTTEMLRWIEIAVNAAEQLYDVSQGGIKKSYVMDFLTGKGYDVKTKEVDLAIESAVLKLHKELIE